MSLDLIVAIAFAIKPCGMRHVSLRLRMRYNQRHMSTIKPITIETIDDLLQYGYTLALNCQPCDRWVMVDLEGMKEAGRGQQSYVEMKFRCSECGEIASKQLRSPLAWKEGQSPLTANPTW